MLQIIVFALILGVILANMGDRVDIVKNFFGQFNDIMMEMTMAVMKLAPIGVFCLIAKTFAEIGFEVFLPLLKYMCFGALSYGIADFFNKYLLSKGFGVQLRNVSIIVGIIMLLIAYPLIYYWGCYGAAYIKAVTGIVYIISIVFTYKKSIKFSNAD